MLKSIGESIKVLVCSAAMLRLSEVVALLLQQNSINVTCMGPGGFRIVDVLECQVLLALI